ncbi:MAG: hypothetical protein JWM57_610 [Phycisphaerales bacterium]|nr:hypothetical protein [Phycisphaerales bacterium]
MPISATSDESQESTNPWAVASLLSGVGGFVLFTPPVAIVAGVISLIWYPKTGRRMAIVGTALGVAWLVGMIAGAIWIWEDGAMAVANGRRATTVDLINRLPAGNLEGPNSPYRIGNTRAKELAQVTRPLGTCRDVVIKHARFSNRDDVFGVEYQGEAIFEHGKWPVYVRLALDGNGWSFTELDLQ